MAYCVLLIRQAASEGSSLDPILASVAGLRCVKSEWVSRQNGAAEIGDLVVAVTAEPAASAAEFLTWLARKFESTPRLAIVHSAASDAVLARASAATDDFLIEPVRGAEFRQRVRRLIGSAEDPLAERLIRDSCACQLVGRAPAFEAILKDLPKLAASDMPALITGETGTGKDLLARAIHQLSNRKSFPFVAADCSVVPTHLFENEIFGHVRGAYTDARQDQRGLVGMAEGGTLFLDEIDSLSLEAQAKLLRFLQDRTYRPLGSDRICHADVNVIAATNRDLAAAVSEKRFRADLYFRLNVIHMTMPPLRERAADIPLLARHFLDTMPNAAGRAKRFSAQALTLLSSYHWPGNVRELGNVVQRAAVLSEGVVILPEHLAIVGAGARDDGATFRQMRSQVVGAFERVFIEDRLREAEGNVTRAARAAGKDRRVFGRMMKKHGISARTFSAAG